MSITVTISGNKSELITYFQPPLNLIDQYECGLLYFFVLNSAWGWKIPNIISIECDLVYDSYKNGLPTHIVHEFVCNTTSDKWIVESPQNIVYFPVNKKLIPSITIKILDQFGKGLHFKDNQIQLQLHLRKAS